MIHLAGATRLSFLFPAPVPAALAFYGERIERLTDYLPHISLARRAGPGAFRMCYHACELGAYSVHIFCDVAIEKDILGRQIRVVSRPLPHPVRARAGWSSTTASGVYCSTSTFLPHENGTRVEFALSLAGDLPTPHSMRVMPGGVRDAIAQTIARRRIHEIAGGFINATRAEYVAQQAPAGPLALTPATVLV